MNKHRNEKTSRRRALTAGAIAVLAIGGLIAFGTPGLLAFEAMRDGMAPDKNDQVAATDRAAGLMLAMPVMNPARGRKLFVSKGCVTCHSINGVGGDDAPPLDFSTMPKRFMNPFDFAGRMWRGAEAMIAMQKEELGYQIELNGQELADIIAFAHDPGEQRKFSKSELLSSRIGELPPEAGTTVAPSLAKEGPARRPAGAPGHHRHEAMDSSGRGK